MRVFLEPLRDLYAESERCAVMVGETVLVLSEIATAIVTSIPQDGIEAAALSAALVDRFGDPGDAASATVPLLEDLQARGIVRLDR